MNNFPIYDDVGSFPLPEYIDRETFNQFYWTTYKAIINKIDIFEHRGIQNYFINPIISSFKQKLEAGVEIINYPQHMDMYTQFLKPLSDYESQPNLIESNKAIIPEINVIKNFAKDYYEKEGKKLEIKICITGPIDLYIKKHNFTIYKDLALNLSQSINHFIKNSIIDTKYLKTSIIAIDEPSFGFVDIVNINDDDIVDILDKCFNGINSDIDYQIHLHSLKKADVPLQSQRINILTCEYASDKSNVIAKNDLEKYDKFIRVGITRTNIDGIIGETIDKGINWGEIKSIEGTLKLIDSKERIKHCLKDALDHYGGRLKYIGPDCGLSGWGPPEVAHALLKRTREIITEVKKEMISKN
ncbi:MAG: hypothetical protein KGD63_11830 [Candidatus Lokiarchaeota archaeon]|nr:hypothetical protein [Candidatus Lokiarchaeota archaeon]